jgi:hypothetical protein
MRKSLFNLQAPILTGYRASVCLRDCYQPKFLLCYPCERFCDYLAPDASAGGGDGGGVVAVVVF